MIDNEIMAGQGQSEIEYIRMRTKHQTELIITSYNEFTICCIQDCNPKPKKEAAAECATLVKDAKARTAALEADLAAFQALEGAELPDPPAPAGESRDGLRPDEPRPSTGPDPLLANAPERIEDFYGVPKTIGGAP